MPKVKLPQYIAWRDGRPRFIASPEDRERGVKGQDLKHPDGRWYSFEEAEAWGIAKNAALKQLRTTNAPLKPPPVKKGRTLERLLADWKHKGWKKLAPASRDSYQKNINAILYRPQTRAEEALFNRKVEAAKLLGVDPPQREREPISLVHPAAIGSPELRTFFEQQEETRGHHMALAMVATISAAFTWGKENSEWRLGANPRLGMRFDRPAGRVVLITIEEFHAVVRAADAMGRHSIGDSWYLGLWTGQRQTDRLAMRDCGLIDGRRRFEQSKTGVIVDIRESPQLAARLEQARARTAALKMKFGTRCNEIVLNETTGLPYEDSTYRHVLGEARALAFKGSNALALPPCPTLQLHDRDGKPLLTDDGHPSMKRDQDLRDTCVMLLDHAGVDLLGICDITGHSYSSAQTIVKHYRARNALRADAAIERLVAFYNAQGATG